MSNDILNTNEEIIEQVEAMFADLKTRESKKMLAIEGEQKHKEHFFSKYSSLKYCYPAIFNMLYETKEHFDIERLKGILNQRQMIKDKQKSVEQASREFGQKMFDEHVKPIVNNLEK